MEKERFFHPLALAAPSPTWRAPALYFEELRHFIRERVSFDFRNVCRRSQAEVAGFEYRSTDRKERKQ